MAEEKMTVPARPRIPVEQQAERVPIAGPNERTQICRPVLNLSGTTPRVPGI
jgi:hypothetical protein